MRILFIVIVMVVSVAVIHGQNVDEIVDHVYQETLIQEALLDSLKDYSYVQNIHFTKLDGDGEIEEESRREFIVRVHSRDVYHRELTSAYELEDEQWVDITEEEKNKGESEDKSVKFSLTEMVSPETRKSYQFTLIGDESLEGIKTIHVQAIPLEEDEDQFRGDLWFEEDSFNLVKAALIPSELPTAVKNMVMEFSMSKFGDIWLPVEVNFTAEISFLFIFKGKIKSDILFEDYRFNQVFADSLFEK
jgi:hypothetical protein